MAPIIWIIGWHLDAASAWNRIPQQDKIYSIARNHKDPKRYDDDELVHDSYASIASLMTDDSKSYEFTLDRRNQCNNNPSPHSAPRRFLLDTNTNCHTMHDFMIKQMRLKFGVEPMLRDADDSICSTSVHPAPSL